MFATWTNSRGDTETRVGIKVCSILQGKSKYFIVCLFASVRFSRPKEVKGASSCSQPRMQKTVQFKMNLAQASSLRDILEDRAQSTSVNWKKKFLVKNEDFVLHVDSKQRPEAASWGQSRSDTASVCCGVLHCGPRMREVAEPDRKKGGIKGDRDRWRGETAPTFSREEESYFTPLFVCDTT